MVSNSNASCPYEGVAKPLFRRDPKLVDSLLDASMQPLSFRASFKLENPAPHTSAGEATFNLK